MSQVNIASTEYNASYKALEIYVSGCTRKCPGCQNSEIQDFNIGTSWSLWLGKNIWKITDTNLVDYIWILGGDLICQSNNSIYNLCSDLNTDPALKNIPKWLWTGETNDSLAHHELFPILMDTFDYIKTGPYDCNNHNKVIYLFGDDQSQSIELVGDNQILYYRGIELEKQVKA